MNPISRVTFISRDKSKEEQINGGSTVYRDKQIATRVLRSKTPNWVQSGCELVAAKDDRTVLNAYTIKRIESKEVPVSSVQRITPGKYYIFYK